MPLSQKKLDEQGVPIYFLHKGEVDVRVGPCSGQAWKADRIPLDGRIYICAGEVILRNGRHLRAHFEIATHSFDFLDIDSVWVTLDGDIWYRVQDRDLRRALGLRKREMFPFRWLPDVPLDYSEPGPYPMIWTGADEEQSR